MATVQRTGQSGSCILSTAIPQVRDEDDHRCTDPRGGGGVNRRFGVAHAFNCVIFLPRNPSLTPEPLVWLPASPFSEGRYTPAKPAHQKALGRPPGTEDQSCRMLRLRRNGVRWVFQGSGVNKPFVSRARAPRNTCGQRTCKGTAKGDTGTPHLWFAFPASNPHVRCRGGGGGMHLGGCARARDRPGPWVGVYIWGPRGGRQRGHGTGERPKPAELLN